MDLSNEFAADLLKLSIADTLASTDVAHLLEALSADARATIESFAGVTFILMVGGRPITFAAFEGTADEARIATSAVLPLTELCAIEAGSVLIVYATQPGALVDFAADAAVALGLAPESVILDRHLVPVRDAPGGGGLAELILINQAIGVLLGRGLQLNAAELELSRLAWTSGTTTAETAAGLIAAAEHSDI